jgi:alkanesulfonate monooxygenase SsuD/methylene tetrahydromethanopterin reductase-like flavin-dependent oxidoreductase (luciferase family)
LDFAVTLQTNPPAKRVIELTQRAEQHGFTHAWTFDSHILWQEPYVIHSQMLSATEKIVVGPFVTNPVSRDPSVTASTFATLNDMFGNRTICGIGRGDSVVRVLGRKPTTLRQLEEAMRVIKDLAEGREADYGGVNVKIPWVEDGKLDVWMAGYGPKALSLVGRKADGFILQLADPVILEWTMKHVHDAAREAAATRRRSRSAWRPRLRRRRPRPPARPVPVVRGHGRQPRRRPRLPVRRGRRGPARPDRLHKGPPGLRLQPPRPGRQPHHRLRPDNIVDRFCVLGTVEDHVTKLTELKDLGVDQFNIYLMHDAMEETLDAYGREIMQAMGKRSTP